MLCYLIFFSCEIVTIMNMNDFTFFELKQFKLLAILLKIISFIGDIITNNW